MTTPTDSAALAALHTITRQLAEILAILRAESTAHTHTPTMGSRYCTTCGDPID